MKKFTLLKYLSVILLLCFVTGCENTDVSKSNTDVKSDTKISQTDNKADNASDKSSQDDEIREKAKAVIYDINIKELKNDERNGDSIPVVSVDVVELKKRNDGYSVFANIIQMTYKLDNGIFNNDTGALFPIRYDMDLEFNIVKVHEVEGGGGFNPSIRKMAENDKELENKLLDSQGSFSSKYDVLMEDLKKNAEIAGLKNFSHKKNEIPGYEKDVREIDDRQPKGVICIIKNADYDKLQEERKEIVPSTVAGKHSVYAPCIYYHEKTGICVEDTFWYFD